MKSVRRFPGTLALLAAAALFASCANSDPAGCKVGADCASGVCNADGTCESTTTGEGGSAGSTDPTGGGGTGGTGGSGASGGSGGSGASGGSGGGGVCSPNDDGTLTAAELPFAAGLSATYRVATNATFDTSGDAQADGSRVWDLTPMFSGDHSVLVETLAPEGTWWANDFAGATYASRLSDSADLLGVFEVKADGLFLLGVVSPEDGFTATNVEYEPPVKVLAFPMKKGDTWETEATVTGIASGVGVFYYETYTSEVDADGVTKTPFADFPVLRVGTSLTRTVGALVTTTRTYSFATECFGTIATVVSQSNELDEEFTDVSELRRLTP